MKTPTERKRTWIIERNDDGRWIPVAGSTSKKTADEELSDRRRDFPNVEFRAASFVREKPARTTGLKA